MNKKAFGLAALIFLFGISHLYSYFKFHFSGLEEAKKQTEELRLEAEKEKLKSALARSELQDFQQNIAQVIPQDALKKSYSLRNIASVIEKGTSDSNPIDSAKLTFLKAKEAFQQNKFEESNKLFKQLLVDFPDSVYVVESNFLLVEGFYKTKDFEQCLTQIENMVTLFPENELTGYALLRLGSIFQMRDRLEEAAEVYRAVEKHFTSNPVLSSQAKALIQQVEP